MTLPPPSIPPVPLRASVPASPGGSAPARALGLRRRARRGLLAVLGSLLAAGVACGDDPAPPEALPDAGPACERGTLDCGCIGGSGCQDDLLCIAGRCLQTEGPSEMGPSTRPRPPPNNPPLTLPDAGVPSSPPPDASAPGAGLDGGAPDAGAADAGDG